MSWSPAGSFNHHGSSADFANNIELINECTSAAKWEAAQILVGLELARQLDRIANVLEKQQ